jgi:sRNA-binding regulator protein Hfq
MVINLTGKIMARIYFAKIVLLLMLIAVATPAWGSIIYLKNGTKIKGKIVQYSEKVVLVHESDNNMRQIKTDRINLITFGSQISPQNIVNSNPNNTLVYLKNGEIVKGQITRYNSELVTLKSTLGHGVLQIPTSEINMIAAVDSTIKMNQRRGIGYQQSKSTLGRGNWANTYNFDKLTYKVFLTEDSFGTVLFSFANSTRQNKKLEVMSADLRYGKVMKKVQNNMVYYGGSIGILKVTDEANEIDASGLSLEAFLGVEMIFPSLPNFGFTAELGVNKKELGEEYSSFDFSTSSFPTFSITYYF